MATGLTKKQKEALTDKIVGMVKNSPALRMTTDSSVNEMNINQISGELNRIHYRAIGKDLPATISFAPKQLGSGDPSPDNIRPIIGYEIDGIGTVYGGELNTETGVLTTTIGGVELGTFDYRLAPSGAFFTTDAADNIETPSSTYIVPAFLKTSIYITRESTNVYNTPLEYDYSIGILSAGRFVMSDSRYSDIQVFKEMLTAAGIVAVYKYATPVTYTLTPQQMLQLLDQL